MSGENDGLPGLQALQVAEESEFAGVGEDLEGLVKQQQIARGEQHQSQRKTRPVVGEVEAAGGGETLSPH